MLFGVFPFHETLCKKKLRKNCTWNFPSQNSTDAITILFFALLLKGKNKIEHTAYLILLILQTINMFVMSILSRKLPRWLLWCSIYLLILGFGYKISIVIFNDNKHDTSQPTIMGLLNYGFIDYEFGTKWKKKYSYLPTPLLITVRGAFKN